MQRVRAPGSHIEVLEIRFDQLPLMEKLGRGVGESFLSHILTSKQSLNQVTFALKAVSRRTRLQFLLFFSQIHLTFALQIETRRLTILALCMVLVNFLTMTNEGAFPFWHRCNFGAMDLTASSADAKTLPFFVFTTQGYFATRVVVRVTKHGTPNFPRKDK